MPDETPFHLHISSKLLEVKVKSQMNKIPYTLFFPFFQTRQFLPTKKILAIERVDESAFQKPNVFQVVSKDYDDTIQILYLAAQVPSVNVKFSFGE